MGRRSNAHAHDAHQKQKNLPRFQMAPRNEMPYALGDDLATDDNDELLSGKAKATSRARRRRGARCKIVVVSVTLAILLVAAFILFRAMYFPSLPTTTTTTTTEANKHAPSGHLKIDANSKVVAADFVADARTSEHLQTHMAVIAVPRPVRSETHTRVREYLREQLMLLGMAVKNVEAVYPDTPIGRQNFINVVATYPVIGVTPRTPTLVLAAHYDTLYARPKFDGAIDSAAPCAMLIEIARAVIAEARAAEAKKGATSASSSSSSALAPTWALQIMFFDGEEAISSWSDVDALYGSRALAHVMENAGELERIRLFVLLDLLGSKQHIPLRCLVPNSKHLCSRLYDIENALTRVNLIKKKSVRHFAAASRKAGPNDALAQRQFAPLAKFTVTNHGPIDDDHKPFVQRGVPALHLIPMPFPNVWHQDSDNVNQIDFMRSAELVHILACFALEFVGFEVSYAVGDSKSDAAASAA